ncbi:MAG: glycosyltransferase [Muribaculaceae bacterium]|nr:glycosyltransferase [Muribaculaceae bacterium]
MEKNLRLIFLSKSDLRGGAAIVTYRLVVALRELGVDARMLVCEKLSEADFVDVCAPFRKIQWAFVKERFKVYVRNGFKRSSLFKIDPASEGLKVWRHPWFKSADAIFFGWVNQGMLSFKGIRRILSFGKPVVWIMHDMWNMTGICHHAGGCTGFLSECGYCPLLGKKSGDDDLSHRIWQVKKRFYDADKIKFVAVSGWLAQRAKESRLMKDLDVAVIPNPFAIETGAEIRDRAGKRSGPVRIIFGAARLDDPIKGLPVLKKALDVLRSSYPEVASNVELVTFGAFKDIDSLRNFAIPHVHLGILKGAREIRNAYESCDIVVSTSDYETLPGTLIEGQAYGCIPVAIDHGGQRDIVDHLKTGWLATWNDSPSIRAGLVAEGIVWAYRNCDNFDLLYNMRKSVEEKFRAKEVAKKILDFTFPNEQEEEW